MKTKIFITAILSSFLFFAISCVKDEIYSGPATITKVDYSPKTVTPTDAVTVTVETQDLQGIVSATIRYKVNGITQTNIAMAQVSPDVFTGSIPAQADESVVLFSVSVVNVAGAETVSNEQAYIVGAIPVDYTQLILNEVDGVNKTIELFNNGSLPIALEGISLIKNEDSNPWWTGSVESGTIAPGGYVIIKQNNSNSALSGRSGISTKQILKFELTDPSGASLGIFQRGVGVFSTVISDIDPYSFQRIPNGTGDWKMANPTNGAVNASSGSTIPQE